MNPPTKRYLTSWVKKHPHGWNHQDWLDLLEQLKAKGYEYQDEDHVGLYIEAKHQDYYGF